MDMAAAEWAIWIVVLCSGLSVAMIAGTSLLCLFLLMRAVRNAVKVAGFAARNAGKATPAESSSSMRFGLFGNKNPFPDGEPEMKIDEAGLQMSERVA